MMNSREEITSYVKELQHTVEVADINHQVWWIYKSKETRAKYIDVMDEYSLFFQAGIHAHFVALLIALYRLYETNRLCKPKRDTFNIPHLLERMRESRHLPDETIDALNEIHNRAAPLWKKVKILRNRAFGHRSTAHTVEELFKKAKVSPDNLGDLIAISKEFLNTFTQAWDRNTHSFDLNAREDTIRLLDDLNGLLHKE